MKEKLIKPYLHKAAYLALGHGVTDLYPAFLPPLLPLLIDRFHFSFTRASLLAMVLGFSASLTQPIFGYLSDKFGGRKMVIFGPIMAGLSISAIGLAPNYSFMIILLILGGLGAAAYHPEAAALSSSLSSRQRTLVMSIFMLGGTIGLGLGPFLILLIIMTLGIEWSLLASLPALVTGWLLHRHAPQPRKELSVPVPSDRSFGPPANQRFFHFGILLAVVVLRVTATGSLTMFLPMIQKFRGFSLLASGSSFSVFMACAALGGLTGGYLADRLGRRRIIISSFVIAIPAFLAFLYWKGPLSFAILALLGFLFFLSEPVCVVLAQEIVPYKARTVSGLVMGVAWGMAGWGVLGTGTLADYVGIEKALGYLLFLPVGALLLSFFLPRK